MKKILFCFICLFCFTGCDTKEEFDYEKEFETLATSYYSEYQRGMGLDIALVTLQDLKVANETMGANFNLSNLEKCSDDSSVKIYLKSGTMQIEKYEFDLKCS